MPIIERPSKKPRDYAKEYAREKKIRKTRAFTIQIDTQLADDFAAKCEIDGVSKSGIVKKAIERYTYGDNS